MKIIEKETTTGKSNKPVLYAPTPALSGTLLKEKAIQITEGIGKNFCASNGWMETFCHRNNIVFKSVCGESADVHEEVLVEWKSRLPLIFEGYSDRDIFNLYETGIILSCLAH